MLTYDVQAFNNFHFVYVVCSVFFITKLEIHGFCVDRSSPRTNALRKHANTLRLSQNLLSNVRVTYSTGQKYGLTFFRFFKTAVEIGPVG